MITKLSFIKNRFAFFLAILFSIFYFPSQGQISLTKISTYHTGVFDESAAEIVAHDPETQKMFVTNGDSGVIDILDISDPSNITLVNSIDLSSYGKSANSVAFKNGILAVAVENIDKQATGKAVFFDSNGNYLNDVTAGALPDNIVFSPNGKYVLVANEGEPNDDFTIDPEGSVTLINLSSGIGNINNHVQQIGFSSFNNALLDPSIRTTANPGNSTVAQDLEPEYITVSHNSKIAWVALQENNALAIIDIKKAKIVKLVGLGFKDHSLAGNGLDASDKTSDININQWPVKGMYMPDAIANYKRRGKSYVVLANEGDSRDYSGYSEEVRVADLTLDPNVFPNAAFLQTETAIGRMKTTTATGDADGDGLFEEIYTYGSRSFSIRRANGSLIYDSGDEMEQITAAELPNDFNSSNEENNSFKNRSDDKGPEPEAVEIAKIKGRYYAFLGLERVGGIMVYDITNPRHPQYIQYINNRDFSVPANTPEAGDLGPEDILFIHKKNSPGNYHMIASANEVSGTVTLFEVKLDGVKNHPLNENIASLEKDHVVENIQPQGQDQFYAYPNPNSSGLLYLKEPAEVTIYDMYGFAVLKSSNSDEIDISSLKKGLYLISSGSNNTKRLVIK